MNSTICAISTALGVGAISIIRCSGPDSIKIVNSVFKGKNLENALSHTINYGHIIYNDEIIDEVLVSIMRAPKTFTCEDIVEINSHGGPATTNKILEILLNSGCELASAGEFTKRAFLNGRINLIEAEAVGDLILSETDKARKVAIKGLTGELTNKITDLRKKIIKIQSEIEVNIDFPEYEEGIDYTKDELKPLIEEINNEINEMIKLSENSALIKQGINLSLIGKPNAGKSSLLNSLIHEDKAIVTDIAGTTRDIVEGHASINGIPFNIIDTAGLRETSDIVEKIGVEKAYQSIENANLVIYVIDSSLGISDEDINTLEKIKEKNVIVFLNKNDQKSIVDDNLLKSYKYVYGNTVKEDGLSNLYNLIIDMFNLNEIDNTDYTFLSNARQISLIKKANEYIVNILDNFDLLPTDVFTIDLKNAYETLGEIIGETYEDDLLDELFSRFCLGK